MRNHNTLSREDVIKTLASCVPEQHKVDLEKAELFILVQIFKASPDLTVSHIILVRIEKTHRRYRECVGSVL